VLDTNASKGNMKRFDIITESDARVLEPGSSVELAPGGHVTPLALDTLREKRITIVRLDGHDVSVDAPPSPITRLAVASDHTGIALRGALVARLRARGLLVVESGPAGRDPVDYPDIAAAAALAVSRGEVDGAIVVDGAGLGSAIAANKVRGVRAAMCTTPTLARYAREHNGANVLTLGATLLSTDEAMAIVDTWLSTPMTEPRYIRRLARIRAIEEGWNR
jgi:ribose 5-phosphate isomerase B